jgi:Tfp pilus assembly protein PilX
MIKFFIKKNNFKKESKNKGFAILFAVLLASFLVTLGISIFSISLKEIQITTSIRDSQIAYYAADSARECALYWDAKKGAFPVAQINEEEFPDGNGKVSLICNGNDISITFEKKDSDKYVSEVKDPFFQASSTSSSTPTAKIQIIKIFNPVNQSVQTSIESYGYNTSIIGRRVERGIKTVNN